jgi:uncharacterized membrane protein
MSFAPLLNASAVIQLHAFAAMAALALGAVQLAAPKGTIPHRSLGWIWVGLMAIVAVSSFWIHDLRMFGPFSWIHGLSVFALVMLAVGVTYARHHNVSGHRRTMIWIFVAALVITGFFTFVPGRIMHKVLFGA